MEGNKNFTDAGSHLTRVWRAKEGVGRPGESWGVLGRAGESWGGLGSPEESWGVLGRAGLSWGVLGSHGEGWGVLRRAGKGPARKRGAGAGGRHSGPCIEGRREPPSALPGGIVVWACD